MKNGKKNLINNDERNQIYDRTNKRTMAKMVRP